MNIIRFIEEQSQSQSKQLKVILFGEGNFSFTKCLLGLNLKHINIISTTFDSLNILYNKYGKNNIDNTLNLLKNIKVLHNIDGTTYKYVNFSNIIIFNFPHSGLQRIHINRLLLYNFFKNLQTNKIKDSYIIISLCNNLPYKNWELEKQAALNGFILYKKFKFFLKDYKYYNHVTTVKDGNSEQFDINSNAYTYIFIHVSNVTNVSSKRKRKKTTKKQKNKKRRKK